MIIRTEKEAQGGVETDGATAWIDMHKIVTIGHRGKASAMIIIITQQHVHYEHLGPDTMSCRPTLHIHGTFIHSRLIELRVYVWTNTVMTVMGQWHNNKRIQL